MSVSVLGVDTNILVRFFTRDDPTQFALAEKLISRAGMGELFIDPIVLVELNWVLRRVYGYGRAEVLLVLNGLVDFREFQIGERQLILKALNLTTTTGADFSDALIALLHEKAGCQQTVTFDTRAQRLVQMVPVEDALI